VIYLIVALQLADIATTHYALKSGAGTEGNPFLRRLFDKFSHEKVLLAIKGAFIAWLLWAIPILQASAYVWVVYLIVAIYVGVIVNNLKVIWRSK
jgi:hypothetical protein